MAMLAQSHPRALRRATQSIPTATLPAFLVPALQTACCRPFSSTPSRGSKLGRVPLSIPPGVELSLGAPIRIIDRSSYLNLTKRVLDVQGPLGKLSLDIPQFVQVDLDTASSRIALSIEDREIKQQREQWGTTWAYLNSYILGVSEGHTAILRLVGIGYRATVELRPAKEEYPGQLFVCLKLGFSHPVELGVPNGVKASAPQPTRILLEGIDKEVVMSFAAEIKKWRRPEPYKGKGIFVNNETIKLKSKKVK